MSEIWEALTKRQQRSAERLHKGPRGLVDMKTLIRQELDEDEPDPDHVLRLTYIWQDRIAGIHAGAVDYRSLPKLIRDYIRVGSRELEGRRDAGPGVLSSGSPRDSRAGRASGNTAQRS
jgi:hypothetical protein